MRRCYVCKTEKPLAEFGAVQKESRPFETSAFGSASWDDAGAQPRALRLRDVAAFACVVAVLLLLAALAVVALS